MDEFIGFTCCICHNDVSGYGNNPEPVNNDDDAECCDDCNGMYVIPARMLQLRSRGQSSIQWRNASVYRLSCKKYALLLFTHEGDSAYLL